MHRLPQRSLLARVRIFDHALPAHRSAALGGEDEGTYRRTPSSAPLTARDRAIEAVLDGLGEPAPEVEHWGREYSP